MLVKIRKKEDGPSAIFSASAERVALGLIVVVNARNRDFEVQARGLTWLFPEHSQDEHFAMVITCDGSTGEVILVAETMEDVEDLRRSVFEQKEKGQLVLAFVRDGLSTKGSQLGYCLGDTSDHAPELPEGFNSVIRQARPESVAEVMISTFGQALAESSDSSFSMECHHPAFGEFNIVVFKKQ
jgi:hypothetical protein